MASVTPPPADPAPQQQAPKKSKVGWIIALVVGVGGCFVVVVLAAVLVPVFMQAREAAGRAAVMGNYKRVAIGVLMYATDYNGRLPHEFADSSDLQFATMTYAGGPRGFDTEGGEMVPNENLAGLLLGEVAYQDETASIYDSAEWVNGGRFVAFLDGGVQFADTFDFEWLDVFGLEEEEFLEGEPD